MILEEFVHNQKKEKERAKALEGLNKKRQDLKGKENFNDDRSKYECEKESECCEPVCRPRRR
jgi:hypothetical protein